MKNKGKKGTVSVPTRHEKVGIIPKTLSELRAQFDGFRNVASKMEESKIKAELLTGIEQLYLSAANWFTGVHGNATEHTA